jgi:hypothetical protein
MIPGSANPLLLASAAEAEEYAISRSLRFNSADSASLSLASYAGSGTFSCWVKRCKLGAAQTIISGVAFNASDQLNGSTAVFRDPSAWMHVVVSSSGTYVNGASVGSGTSITPSAIGSGCDLYLADAHFIDGQNLDATSFGEFDTNGIWQPKAYTGTYNTNGFHLTFSDNSTAASLGDDSSGNGNNWTVNNISAAAGAGNDSLVDVPTNGTETDSGLGAEVRGNYCTWSPVDNYGTTLSDGNLHAVSSTTTGIPHIACGSIGVSSGKWYWEVTLISGTNAMIGICDLGVSLNLRAYSQAGGLYVYQSTGGLYGELGGTFTNSPYTTLFSLNDVVGVALDMDNGNVEFYKNGVALGTANTSSLLGKTIAPALTNGGASVTDVANFGQRPFAYTAPSGFKALCTANLPSTTITTSGSYTGNGVADGPFVFLNGVPTAMTIGGNSVTFGTDADKLSNGFKIRTTSTTFNQNASTYNYSITSTGDPFKTARAQAN